MTNYAFKFGTCCCVFIAAMVLPEAVVAAAEVFAGNGDAGIEPAGEWCKCKPAKGLCKPIEPIVLIGPMLPIDAIELIECIEWLRWWWWMLCKWPPYWCVAMKPPSSFGLISRPLPCRCDIGLCEKDIASSKLSWRPPRFLVCLRSFARRFWNQIFTCRSDKCSDWANSDLRRMVM